MAKNKLIKDIKTDNDKVYKAHTFLVKKDNPLYYYLENSMKNSNNLYNAANFHIRQVYTGLTKDGELHNLQSEIINSLNDSIDSINEKRISYYENKLLLYDEKLNEFNKKLKELKELPENIGLTEKQIIKEYKLKKPKKPNCNTFDRLTKDNNFISYNLMDAYFNYSNNVDYYSLPAQVNQATIKKLYSNWDSFFESLKDFKVNPSKYKGKPKIPKYKKSGSLHEVVFTNQNCKIRYDEENKYNYLIFPKTDRILNLGNYINTNMNLSEVRVQKFYDSFKVELVEDVTNQTTPKKEVALNKMALDLGVNNLSACVCSNGAKPLLINGKPLKSINQYYNLIRADLYGQLRQGYNSKQGTFTSKRLNFIDKKRYLIIKDYMHKASNKIVKYAIANEVDKVIIGHNKGWKEEFELKKKDKQNFIYISFNMLIKQLQYKLSKYGIEVEVKEESYTSKASAIDMDHIPSYNPNSSETYCFSGKRIKRGLYKTKSGILINADINGACNILRKHCEEEIKFDVKLLLNPEKFTPKRAKKPSSTREKTSTYKNRKLHFDNKKKLLESKIIAATINNSVA